MRDAAKDVDAPMESTEVDAPDADRWFEAIDAGHVETDARLSHTANTSLQKDDTVMTDLNDSSAIPETASKIRRNGLEASKWAKAGWNQLHEIGE
jgi:hypothetical protein